MLAISTCPKVFFSHFQVIDAQSCKATLSSSLRTILKGKKLFPLEVFFRLTHCILADFSTVTLLDESICHFMGVRSILLLLFYF